MDILVVLENKHGAIHLMSREALAVAQEIGSECGLSVGALALGADATPLAAVACDLALDEVLLLEHDLLANYTADGFSTAVAEVISSEQPRYIFFGHTYQVRDYVPRISAKIRRPFLNDVVTYSIVNGKPEFSKQAFNAKLIATLQTLNDGPILVSVQSAAFSAEALQIGSATVRAVNVDLSDTAIRTRPEEPFQEATGGVDLSSAEIIVSVGRGIGKEEHILMAQKLAKVLGAELAASRPVVDADWLPPHHQVGSSGQTVAPKLYLALGISGAIQHVVGMKGSKNIIVINKDLEAPIFEIADYGVVGDVLEILPKLTAALQ